VAIHGYPRGDVSVANSSVATSDDTDTRSGSPRADNSFVTRALADPRFQATGVVSGQAGTGWWAVIDPTQHPLFVWRQTERGPFAYGRTALKLDAVVFSNGPMMGKRLGSRWKMGRRTAMAEVGAWTVLGGLAGLAASRGRLVAGLVGGGIGGVVAWKRAFTNWLACGTVRSRLGAFEDGRNFDDEGRRHAWLGRRGRAFEAYAIGDGDLPADAVEGAGGLIRVLRDGRIAREDPDFVELRHKRGCVVWSLLPLDPNARGRTNDGVLVVFGSQHADLEEAAVWLQRVGARDAVATDQRAMIMLGGRGRCWIGPPQPHRQGMQQYGFCCG
jgi:hypothetical protein